MEVFFDIETLKANIKAKPAEHQVVEYVVTAEYDYRKKHYFKEYANLYLFIESLLHLNVKKIKLFAHNGERYDFHFLRRALIDYYGLIPQNGFLRNAVNHENEVSANEIKGDYLLEYRVKAKTDLALNFRIDNTVFTTADTFPKFQASILTLGKLLYHHGIIKSHEEEKLEYDYVKYDLKQKLSKIELRNYAMKVYKNLDAHEHKYVSNDTHILYLAYKNYNVIFPNFDRNLRTLSQNILKVYEVNNLSYLQLLGKNYSQKVNYSEFNFDNENFFEYLHHFYKGGLNFYNDNYLGKIVHNLAHIDLNSSYPTAMYYNYYPTFLLEGDVINDNLRLEDRYYYFLKISKKSFNVYIKGIKSRVVRKMFVKYFNNSTNFVYLQTPHIELLEKFLGRKIKDLPVISFLKFESRLFGARDVIKKYYEDKVNAKKQGLSYGEIYTKKVILNGIYGIPALRSHYNLFETFDNGESYVNQINGFKNSERNIVFASTVTAYSLYQLLEPLTFKVDGIDQNFIYCDTDSLFLKQSYFKQIKPKIKLDHYQLGAWDLEHDNVSKMYVLNHKKYALEYNKKIEVTAGGVPQNTFNLNMEFKEFIDTQFHDKAILPVQKNFYTNDKVITIYHADTELNIGKKYPEYYDDKTTLNYILNLGLVFNNEIKAIEENQPEGIYYETPYGAIAISEAFPYKYDINYSTDINRLIIFYNKIKEDV